jgi:hypothetical protein
LSTLAPLELGVFPHASMFLGLGGIGIQKRKYIPRSLRETPQKQKGTEMDAES